MSENDVKTSETTVEKEIIIDLEDKDEVKNENISESVKEDQAKPKVARKIVDRKQIVDLTDDERAIIVNNARNGYDQPYYDVKLFKNGKYRIIKKKETAPSVAQKVITSTNTPEKEKKAYYSDNQLLFEHIIELNAKVDKLMTKHKKLKRKYQTLQNDIYADEDEISVPQMIESKEPEPEVKNEVQDEVKKEPKNESLMQKQQPTQQRGQSPQPVGQVQTPVYTKRMNWRQRLSYL